MIKMTVTDAFVSKGFEGKPAIYVSEKGDFLSFKIGKRIYDKRAENNTRWLNLTVKVYNNVCERVKAMNLKEGSCIHISGRFDMDSWTDNDSGRKVSAPVLIADDVEYSYNGSKKKDATNDLPPSAGNGTPPPASSGGAPGGNPDNFDGFENFPEDGTNPFFTVDENDPNA